MHRTSSLAIGRQFKSTKKQYHSLSKCWYLCVLQGTWPIGGLRSQRLRAKALSLENARTNDDNKQTCKGRQQMLSSSRRQRHSRETESRNRINRTLCEQPTWHERLETKRSKTKSLEKHCGRARGPLRKGQRTENGGWGGEWRKAMHTQNENRRAARGRARAGRRQGARQQQ